MAQYYFHHQVGLTYCMKYIANSLAHLYQKDKSLATKSVKCITKFGFATAEGRQATTSLTTGKSYGSHVLDIAPCFL